MWLGSTPFDFSYAVESKRPIPGTSRRKAFLSLFTATARVPAITGSLEGVEVGVSCQNVFPICAGGRKGVLGHNFSVLFLTNPTVRSLVHDRRVLKSVLNHHSVEDIHYGVVVG